MQVTISRMFVLIISCLPLFSLAQTYNAKIIHKIEGFEHPESVVLDSINKVLFVSNIGDKEPGDGSISRLGVNGQDILYKWVTGLNDPKGMLLLGKILYVTDNTDLVLIDTEKAQIIERVKVEGAGFLNDIAEGPEGSLFISDTRNSSIFKREASGKISEWMNTGNLENPNGLLVLGNELFIAAWGGEGPGNVLRVHLNSKEINKVTNSGIGNLDGIQKGENGNLFVSDWATGKIYSVLENKDNVIILTSAKSSGDILYLNTDKQIIVPMNIQNEVWWYQLE